MNIRWPTLIASALALACMTTVSADDGEKTLKEMTGGSTDGHLTVAPEDIGHTISDAEHAFTDMMKFYVPVQLASGGDEATENVIPGVYNNIDGEPVETVLFAKPLVSVYIYGPTIPVEDTAFAHSFMDVFAAVSLDDGLTTKKTNISQHANLSSFTLGVDGVGDRHDGGDHEVPADHNQIEKDDGLIAFHAKGMDYPYANECTECHGPALQGGHHNEPSCYSCHGPVWKEDAPDGIMVVFIDEATVKTEDEKFKLKVNGAVEGVDDRTTATLINGVTEAFLDTVKVEDNGKFHFELEERGIPPCTVRVLVEDAKSSVIPVVDKKTGDTLEVCEGEPTDLSIYPGGAYNVFHATAGNKVLVAWPSRYCRKGQPGYSFAWDADPDELLDDPNALKRNAIAEYLDIDVTEDLYLTDLFEVAGSQGSIDFAEEGYPQAGEVPFGCVWTARGVLRAGDDPRTDETEATHMVWTKPERLTSGRRDPNRIEVKGVQGAGFVITWQEDPDGLRPGQGLGPGEGWSGAVAHDKTDVWYSFIPWEHFDTVEIEDITGDGIPDPINIVDHDLELSGRPQVYVPMAVPMRLTNNDKCNAEYYGPEGIIDFDDPQYFSYCNHLVAVDYGLQDFCATTVEVPTGQSGEFADICVNEDGLPNIANTASTRPRTSLQGYSSENDGVIDSAWVIVAAEESKGLGRYAFLFEEEGIVPCDEDTSDDPDCGADIGKNQWYFSFDMGDPRTSDSSDHANGLVQNLVKQGNLLNQPEVDWRTGDYYPTVNTSLMWEFGEYNYDLYNTEIARRSSLLVQSIAKASASESGILATPSWKQGAMRQGGPADTMLRRIVMPNGYADGIDTNPYAFSNMECTSIGGSGGWILTDGSNPYYPDGICMAPATNLSSVIPDTCKDDDSGAVGEDLCPTVDFTSGTTFGIGNTNPILQGYIQGEGNTTRVLTWHQCPSDGVALDTSEITTGGYTYRTCDDDNRTDDFVNLKDQSWYNPLDVSKGHRGFIDGDFVMFLYAWSPNWRLNAKGNDRYDLYVRRSFDGGQTWQTTPSSFTASDLESYTGDGTVTCENYRSTETQVPQASEPSVCYAYGAGANEQARNITQHSRMRVTTLDPRYAPTPASITDTCTDGLDEALAAVATCVDTGAVVSSNLRNPSRYFMVYETGDNSTVQVGEAEPMDLFYGRAESFGDDYVVWTETDTGYDDPATVCYPSVAYEDAKVVDTVVEGSGFCNEFDRMNAGGDTHSSEANLEANPDGSKLYGVWAQWVFDDLGEEVIDSEANMRRIWLIDNYRSPNLDLIWTLQGINQGTN
ncbi:MAG: hypothetical protein GWP62_11980 [Gammaproteobacteria bacterium]|nr:hypothetical protein [Gammaproteobacteria bacterium]